MWPLVWPTSWNWAIRGSSPHPCPWEVCMFHLPLPLWELFSRTQTWESSISLRSSGRGMWLNPFNTWIFKILEGRGDLLSNTSLIYEAYCLLKLPLTHLKLSASFLNSCCQLCKGASSEFPPEISEVLKQQSPTVNWLWEKGFRIDTQSPSNQASLKSSFPPPTLYVLNNNMNSYNQSESLLLDPGGANEAKWENARKKQS